MNKVWRDWKKIAGVIAAIVVIGSVSSCSDSTESPPAEAPKAAPIAKATTPKSATEVPTGSALTRMEDFYHQRLTEFLPMSRSTSIDLGKTICESLESGLSFDLIGVLGLQEIPRLGAEGMGTAIGGAVTIWCPEYSSALDKWVKE